MNDLLTTAELIANLHAEVKRGQETIRALRADLKNQEGRFESYVQSRLAEQMGIVETITAERNKAIRRCEELEDADNDCWRFLRVIANNSHSNMTRGDVVVAITANIAQMKSDQHEQTDKKNNILREATAEIQKLTKRINEISDERNAAFADLTRLRAEMKQKTDEAVAKADRAEGEYRASRDEVKRLRARLVEVQKDAKADCERKLKALSGDKEFTGAAALVAELAEAKKKIVELENRPFTEPGHIRDSENQRLTKALITISDERDYFKNQYDALRREVRTAPKLVDAVWGEENDPAALKRQIAAKDERIADLEQRIVSLSAAAEAGRDLVAKAAASQQEAERKLAAWSQGRQTPDLLHRRAQNAEGAYQRLARLVIGWQKEARAVREWEGSVERDEWTVGVYLTKMQEAFNRIYARLLGVQITTLDENQFVLVERKQSDDILWSSPPPQSADEAARRLAVLFDENNPRYPSPKDAVFLGRFGYSDLWCGKGDIDLIVVSADETIKAWLSDDQAKWREPVKEAHRRARAKGLIATSPAAVPTSPAE